MEKKSKEITLRLMIVNDNGEHAEAIVSNLRNGGIAVRPSRPQSIDEVKSLLQGPGQTDLILASDSQSIPLSQVRAQIVALGKDIPLIWVSDTLNEDLVTQSIGNGVRSIVMRKSPEHLLHVVRMEFSNLIARRDLRRLEAQMRETERRCDALISSSRDPIAYVHEGMHIRANEAYLEMFAFDHPDDIECTSLLDLVAPRDVENFKQVLKNLGKGEPHPQNYELEARAMNGDTFPAVMEFTSAVYEGESCLQVVFRRREEIDPELAREVEQLRQRDSSTGLLNRPTFILSLEDAVARAGRGEMQFGLLLIEPDNYTHILASIGLDHADTMISALALHLESQLQDDTLIARFGDNSFSVLLKGNYSTTVEYAERIRRAFAEHIFAIGSRSSGVTVRVGGVQIGEQIASVGHVLTRVFDSVREAGELGGNAISIYDPGAAERAEQERTQRWIDQLEHALKNNEFVLHYQPVTSLMGESIELYQAFLRLKGKNELISPTAFLEVAEERDIIARIDRWVIFEVVAQLIKRKKAGRTTHLLARFGPALFSDTDLIDRIIKELTSNGISGSQLWLQTPESKVFTHLHAAQQCLERLSACKCRMGLEKFGAGLDSFQLLTHFKPSFIKLDRSLTNEVSSSTESLEKVQNIMERAKALGIITFAEFVGDAASMSAFFSAGLDYVQGEFIAPISAEMN